MKYIQYFKAPLYFADYLEQIKRVREQKSCLWLTFYKVNLMKVRLC